MKHSSKYGYYLEVEKSYFVCKVEDNAVAQEKCAKIGIEIQMFTVETTLEILLVVLRVRLVG